MTAQKTTFDTVSAFLEANGFTPCISTADQSPHSTMGIQVWENETTDQIVIECAKEPNTKVGDAVCHFFTAVTDTSQANAEALREHGLTPYQETDGTDSPFPGLVPGSKIVMQLWTAGGYNLDGSRILQLNGEGEPQAVYAPLTTSEDMTVAIPALEAAINA